MAKCATSRSASEARACNRGPPNAPLVSGIDPSLKRQRGLHLQPCPPIAPPPEASINPRHPSIIPPSIIPKLDTDVSDPEDGAIEGFAIAGEDRKFHPANVAYAEKGKDDRGRVQYDRKQLVLTSPMVPQPIHFRYAWGRNPLANLQATGNKDLPFATQRSDNWKMEGVPLGVLGDDVALPLSRGDKNKITEALLEQDKQRRVKEATQFIEANGS